tara:strand:+ start:10034 stop:11560 length:1527 start_codon:yes stop_codon:yes gene_type:complete
MKIILRCDYFQGSGIGHLKRTSILSNALKKKGFKTIVLVDDIPKDNKINLKVDFQEIPFENFNELDDADFIVRLANLSDVKIIVGDSYRITKKWVERLKQNGLKVVLLDDFNLDLGADLSINYTPYNKFRRLSNSCRQKRGPKFFLTDSIFFKSKEDYPKRIIAHAGGNGDYSKARNIYINLADNADKIGIPVDWVCPNSFSIKSLKKLIKFNDNDQVLTWRNDSSELWHNYQIVVGPASTSLYEAIIQGTLPISFPISKTQCTDLNDWLSLGHSLHINNEEKENSHFINLIFELAINNYSEFLNILREQSKDLDGNGVQRVIDSIESLIVNSNNIFLNKDTKFIKKGILKCTIEDSQYFLLARNSKEVRKMSTDPEHIITWPEHLKWWLNSEIDKYLFIDELNFPEAYFWVKKWKIFKKGYITAGWFPSGKKTSFTSILKILDWQIKYYSKRCKDHTWVATVNKNNKAAIAINRRVGFVDASNDIYNVLPILFPGTDSNFRVFELKL